MRTKEEAVAILKSFDIGNKFSYLPVLPKASVLIPLLVRSGRLHTLMTLRSSELRTNAGEVCFPGGKRDPSDGDDVDTALREAEEEIGLAPDGVQVVCRLFPVMSKVGARMKTTLPGHSISCSGPISPLLTSFQQSGLLVTPVVGFIEESFCPRPNPAEVSAVFTVPLDVFIGKDHGAHGMLGPLNSFHYEDPDSGSQYHIWGLTAMFAILVAALALKKKPEFDAGFDHDDPLPFFQQVLHRRICKL
ncbi:peroxisomal coenzyme A diphosphatase NUDT7 isoform X1 [Scophthalmus maximus]|uniref:peroxisomal coenzyme A diphosphatase NUDT7 isoform X1 n=1 Tax=Scophthalmus maximus TaxID=52904 RepID=UPI0015E113C4|nr:peroxisomal coenzyme A diphosphatase NUDT7 isoform X1 [Scophthalmus maximus]